MGSLGPGEVGRRPVGPTGPCDKPGCLLEGCWEHVNKRLIRAIVFIPFSSHLNGLLPSQRTFFLSLEGGEGDTERGFKI